MSSDNEKKGGGGPPADDNEWDAALSEWDSKTFVPEIAKDTSTDKPAAPPVVSKPLYRPPAPPTAKPRPPIPSIARPPPPPPAPPAARPPPPAPPPAVQSVPPEELQEIEEEEGGATVIASIPQELLRSEEAGPKSSSRGGLGQMFARDEKRDASVEVSFDESQPRMPASEIRANPPSDVFTSAKPVVPSQPDKAEATPLRRPWRPSASEPTEEVHRRRGHSTRSPSERHTRRSGPDRPRTRWTICSRRRLRPRRRRRMRPRSVVRAPRSTRRKSPRDRRSSLPKPGPTIRTRRPWSARTPNLEAGAGRHRGPSFVLRAHSHAHLARREAGHGVVVGLGARGLHVSSRVAGAGGPRARRQGRARARAARVQRAAGDARRTRARPRPRRRGA